MSQSLLTTIIYGPVTTLTTITTTIVSTQVTPGNPDTTHLITLTQTYTTSVNLTGPWTPVTTATITLGPSPSSSSTNSASTSATNSTLGSSTSLPTSLTPTPTAVIESKLSKGVPTGTVVGIGIGTALAGAFITLLGVWLFLQLSQRSRRSGKNSSPSHGEHVGKFGGAKNSIGKVSTSLVALDDMPFDPADDSQIRKYMQDLYELIHQHAENHYHAWKFEGQHEDLRHELAKGGWNDRTEPSAQTMASLLANPVTRRVAIRHIIAWTIIQHIDLENSPNTSLLSAHIVASGQALLKIKRTPGEQEAFSNLFPKWRHLTAALLSPLSSRTDNSEWDSSLRPGVMRNTELLNRILRPFIKSGKEAQLAQSDNLASIIFEGAHFGYLLFSQPAVWIFSWDRRNSSQGGTNDRRSGGGFGNGSADKFLVVFPSIGKLTMRDGSDRGRVVVDAMLERI